MPIMSEEAKFKHGDMITIVRNGVSSELACALWTDGNHRCHFHKHKFIGSKEDILSRVQEVIAEEELAVPMCPTCLVKHDPVKRLCQTEDLLRAGHKEKMTDTQILDTINEWLFWDYDKECWKPRNEDPNWNGLDLVCAIAELLEENGHGPK